MSRVIVRDATPVDFASIDALLLDVYVGEGYTAAHHAAAFGSAAERSKRASLLVACDASGAVLGTLTLVLHGGGEARISREGETEIRLLAVSKDARGGGAGSALVRESLSRARDAGRARCVLSTQPSMAVAHRIYERAGFLREPARDHQNASGIEMRVYAIDL